METAMLAREMLETFNDMDKHNLITKHKFLLRGENLFIVMLAEVGGMSTPSEMAAYTDFSPARLSAIIKSLENKGFIARQQNELDKRCSIIEITEKGIEYTSDIKTQTINNSLEVIEKLGEKDAAEFIRLMKRLLDIMCEE